MASREKKLAQNTILLMIGKICTQCVSFLMLPLYTAVLSTSEYGTADLIITYISLLSPLISLQLEQGLFRHLLDCRDDSYKQKSFFSSVFMANIIQIILFTIICLFLRIFVKSNLLIYLYILIILQLLQGTLLQFARGIDKTLIYTIASFINAFIHVSGNVILVGVIRIGLSGLLMSMVIAGIVSSVYLLLKLHIWNYIDFKLYNKNDLISIVKYSIPLIPNQLAWWVINASDRTIISLFLGTGSNGIYSVANKFSSVFITFYNYFNMSWTESVSVSINDQDSKDYVQKMTNSFFNLLAAVCIGIIACMPFIFPLLINSEYNDAYNHIPILMIAVFFQALQGLYSAVYVALKKTKEIAKTSILSAVINILVNLMLIKFVGLYAASISTLVAFLVMCVYRYFDIKKYRDFSIYKRNIVLALFVCALNCATYYSRNKIAQFIVLVCVIMYSFALNNSIILSIIKVFKRKIRRN